ncbi:MAG: phosphatase PAP2 family protein [Acidobacteriota bacterium]|nr:phosphatase PAP2 family protein [Acidobacteriota bacterium]
MKENAESFFSTARSLRSIAFLFCFLLIFVLSTVKAQEPVVADRLNGTFLKQLLADTGKIIASPARWKENDWLIFGLSLAASSAWLPVDNSIHDWIDDSSHSGLTSVAKVFSGAGQPLGLLGILSAGYLVGQMTDSSCTRQTFLLAGESLLMAEIFVQAGKIAFGRARPYTSEGSLSFHPFTLQRQWQSFPSGHSTAVWAVATTLAFRTDRSYLKALLYSLAAGVSLSRVILDKHFASDVVASSLLGYYIGQKIGHKAAGQANSLNKTAVYLSIGPGLALFGLNYQF